ncbi:DUF3558 family protein [Amycolatopsis sp. NPDC059657]|uniref:DUF3558 family protein n=1 Tax=Amycolatopsis sp. NPDC059657 TaxID=3346899 RepID=UPI00366E849C
MRRSHILTNAGLASTMLLALTACGTETTPGTPTPVPSPSASAPGSRPQIPTDLPNPGPSTSAPSTAPSALAGISPCSVVPPTAIAELGASGTGEEKKLGLARHCGWYPSGKEALGVGFFDTAGIKDATGRGEKTSVKVGTGAHEAVQQDRGGVCAVSIAIGVTSRVDVQVGGFPPESCQKAKTLADAVEPLLPPQTK